MPYIPGKCCGKSLPMDHQITLIGLKIATQCILPLVAVAAADDVMYVLIPNGRKMET